MPGPRGPEGGGAGRGAAAVGRPPGGQTTVGAAGFGPEGFLRLRTFCSENQCGGFSEGTAIRSAPTTLKPPPPPLSWDGLWVWSAAVACWSGGDRRGSGGAEGGDLSVPGGRPSQRCVSAFRFCRNGGHDDDVVMGHVQFELCSKSVKLWSGATVFSAASMGFIRFF